MKAICQVIQNAGGPGERECGKDAAGYSADGVAVCAECEDDDTLRIVRPTETAPALRYDYRCDCGRHPMSGIIHASPRSIEAEEKIMAILDREWEKTHGECRRKRKTTWTIRPLLTTPLTSPR